MASGFSPPSDERSRSTRGSDSSNPGANVRGLVPAVSVVRARTQSRHRTQPQATGSDGTSTPSPQPEPSLSSQQATFLAGAAIQTAHQASHMASSAASSALQGHQAAVFARARERQTEEQAYQVVGHVSSEAHQVVDHVRSEAQAFGHQVVAETQAEAARFKQNLERQAREVLASATTAVGEAEARSHEAELVARREAMEMHAQLGGTRRALSESNEEAQFLRLQNQQLQAERSTLMARLERVESLLAERTPVPSPEGRTLQRSPSPRHYPQMSFSPDHVSHNATVPMSLEPTQPVLESPVAPIPAEQSAERVAQPTRLQALFEGAASGASQLGGEGPTAEQPASARSQDEHAWARDYDLFGPGPTTVEEYGDKKLVVDDSVQLGSVEARVTQLTNIVQELAKLVTTSVASTGAQPLEGAALGAPAASSSQDAMGLSGNPAYQGRLKGTVPTLRLSSGAPLEGSGAGPPGSPSSSSSSSSSSEDDDKPACRMCGSRKHHEKDCPKLTANRRKDKGPPSGSPGGSGGGSASSSPGGSRQDAGIGSAIAEKTPAEIEEETIRLKSLSDLTFPSPPENAAQARGFINQTLMAIGRVQRTAGDEVYKWGQDCMTLTEGELKADPRFPRLDREIAAKLIRSCRKGRFGLMFQQQVEQERARSGGMPNGRCMLRAIFRHFQLERDRIGMLAERNLLNTRLAGGSLQDLEDFRDKYLYVLTTIPDADLPKPSTLFNHLIDELDKCPTLKPKVEKARESKPGSHRRTTEWLWNRVDIALELHQQKINRQEFDRTLKGKPQVLSSNTQLPKGNDSNAAPAPLNPPTIPAAPAPKDKKNKKKKKEKGEPEVPAAPAKGKGKGKGKGDTTPRTPPGNRTPRGGRGSGGNTTPRSEQARRAGQMTKEEKARTPCMFYAFGSCRAAKCDFLHDDSNKYTGPPPRFLAAAKAGAKAKPKPKPRPKATASIAPLISAMPVAAPQDKVTWIWDTGAGRHLIGKQALNHKAAACVRRTDSPVGFATGGGAREGNQTLSFEGSRLLPKDEQVYVLKECPPALSIGKTVIDGGHLFVWDPREDQPYLVAKSDLHRCKMRVPRNARINATKVVEYVPQFDEQLQPRVASSSTSLSPVTTALPSPPEGEYPAGEVPLTPKAGGDLAPEGYEPTEVGSDDEEAAIVEAYAFAERVRDELFRDGAVRPEAAAGPEPAPAPAPVPPAEDPRTKEERLRAEATSEEHLRTHFPKNPYCKICSVAKTTAARVARKPDTKADDKIDAPTKAFEQLATDDVIIAKGDDHVGIGVGGVKTHHVVRDVFSGARVAYPMSRRGAPQHARNFRHFLGLRAGASPPSCLIKMDEAGELIAAAEEVGLTPETSLPNRWPHNATLERDIREEKECCRAIHLQSGLPYDMHTYSFPYACLSLSFDRKAPLGDKTQWEALTKEPFNGRRACFGQLVWYRKKGSKKTLDPNMAPGLFLGWRVDPGMRYRGVLRVMDYTDFREKRNVSAIDVPEPELFIEEGPPVFPVANATHKSLVDGSTLESAARRALPDYPLREVPFPPEGDAAPPPTPRDGRPRAVYITVERIIKFGETPGCKACLGKNSKHTDACRKRFSELLKKEREELTARKTPGGAEVIAETPLPPMPSAPTTPSAPPMPRPIIDPPYPIDPEARSSSDPPPPRAAAPGAAMQKINVGAAFAQCSCKGECTSLAQSTRASTSLPVFGMPAKADNNSRRSNANNKRSRKQQAPSKLTAVFEYACSSTSMLGRVHAELKVPHVRLSKDGLNVRDPRIAEQLHSQLRDANKKHLWVSLPCTSGCPWHRIGLALHGPSYRKKHAKEVAESRALFKQFTQHAKTALDNGHDVTFEWPRYSDSWKRNDVQEFFKDSRFRAVDFDGCRLGVVDKRGLPIKKPWRLMTTSSDMVEAFKGLHCRHKPDEHGEARGKALERTGFYTQAMCELIAKTINPKVGTIVVPALPVVAICQDKEHREIEQGSRHVSAMAGFAELAAVVETDETTQRLVSDIVDLNGLISEIEGLPKDPSSPEVMAMVTKLLSRAEMLASPEALAAVRAEADGLRSVPTWDEDHPREFEDVRSESRKSGVKVHFGRLMTIASIKFYELAKHLQKMKGRIVYRGDCAKDEEGAAAVYRELGANPTSVQGLNACMAYGALPGHQTTTADAIKAYVQAYLKSNYQTWIELPPELRPSWWRQRFARPVVLLLRALYGHPEAGGLWEQHLKVVLRSLGGEEIQEYPGNFWFPTQRLLLSTYVDDLTLSGPQEEHQAFWAQLTSLVDVEPPEPVYRVLGRNHYIINAPTEGTDNAALGALKDAVALDMVDYAQQTVDLYLSITGHQKLRHAPTPFCPEGSLVPSDDDVKGELAPNACKILMKALWLGRLARPDIVKPIGDLATHVQKWSRNHDKQLHRLICYIDSSKTHRLVGTIRDDPGELHLALYVDADFAGEKADARSTSGGYLVLKGPNSFFPLAWLSKRQTSVSRSTTESEIVSLAHSLYQEGLPALSLWTELLGRKDLELVIHEDNQATILVAKKGYSPKLRHISRTHKVNLGCISEQLAEGSNVTIQYVDTAEQAADIFTKALPPQQWDNALRLLGLRQRLPPVLQDQRQLPTKLLPKA